ncbi:MAG: hypothetical protein LUD15_03535 [Bacteroides sp.]|nr:hypothetical protein [Bacteroides sp.]
MALKSPVTGLGYNGFEGNYMNYQAEYFKQKRGNKSEACLAGNVVSAYNEPIRIIVEHGFVGLFLYLSLVFVILFQTKGDHPVFTTIKAAILVYIIVGFFSYPNRVFSLQVTGVILFASLLNTQKGKRYKLKVGTPLRICIQSTFILLVLFFSLKTLKIHSAYKEFQAVLKDPPKEISVHLDKLDSIMLGDALYLQNCCVALHHKRVDKQILLDRLNKAIKLSPSSTLYRMKGDCLGWMKHYAEAEHAYQIAHYMTSSQQRSRSRLVMLYLEMNRIVEAKKLAKEILNEKAKVNGLDAYLLRQEMEKVISLP